MKRRPLGVLAALLLLAAAARTQSRPAGADALARAVPADAIAYAEVPRPAELLRLARSSGLEERLKALPSYAEFLKTPEGFGTIGGLAAARAALGMELDEAIERAAGRGAAIALLPHAGREKPDFLLLVRGADEASMRRVRDGLAQLGGFLADGAWVAGKATASKHGDVEIVSFGKPAAHALVGDVLVSSDDRARLAEAIDRVRSGAAGGLDGVASFAEARREAGAPQAFAWVNVDVAAAKLRAQLRDDESRIEPFPELLFGGIRRAFVDSPWASLAVSFERGGATIRARAAGAKGEPAAARAVFYGDEEASARLEVPRLVATATLRRDVKAFWDGRSELLSPEFETAFGKFNSTAGLFFGGKRVDEDLLPKLAPIAQVVVARQTYAGLPRAPRQRIPAFALVLRARDASPKFLAGFPKAFSQLMLISGLDRGQKGLRVFENSEETFGGIRIATSAFPELAPSDDVPLEYNFAPACFTSGDHVVVSSTIELAKDLVTALAPKDAPKDALAGAESATPIGRTGAPRAIDELALRSDESRAALRENFEVIVAQQVLEKGKTKPQAEREMRAFLDLLSLVSGATIESRAKGDGLEIVAQIADAGPATRRITR